MVQSRRIVLNSRPVSAPSEENFRFESFEFDTTENALSEGEISVKTLWVSIDPYLRGPLGNVGDTPRPPFYVSNQFKDSTSIAEIGDLIGGRCVGEVLASKNPKIAKGDLVAADWKWQEYTKFNPDTELTFEKVDKDIFTNNEKEEKGKIRVSTFLGALGVSGSHAYFGYHEGLQHPKAGETLVVSSAAGSIGVVVDQLGKHDGLHVIGITSGAKAKRLVEDKFVDVAVDYKSAGGDVAVLSKKLKEVAPKGIDLYYDNTKGFITDAVLENLNPGARVYICGGVSVYNDKDRRMAIYSEVPKKEGVQFTTGMTIAPKYLKEIPHARAELVRLAREGHMKFPEEVYEKFENIPKAFLAMLAGQNYGKMVVKV